MPLYRDEGVVIRTHKLGEVDRIVTLLTKNHGQVRAVAKGVRKPSSRFGARLEPFMVADIQFYEGRTLDTISQAESLSSYGGEIVADYEKFTAANAIVETAERLSRETSSAAQYLLLVGALRSLARGEHSTQLVLDAYLLRALALSGWRPALQTCQGCGAMPTMFAVQSAASYCRSCAHPGAVAMGANGLELMSALLGGDWDTAKTAPPELRQKVSGVVAAYLHWQLERGLKSMAHLESNHAS